MHKVHKHETEYLKKVKLATLPIKNTDYIKITLSHPPRASEQDPYCRLGMIKYTDNAQNECANKQKAKRNGFEFCNLTHH